MNQREREGRGFTLIELIIVVVIIGILALVAIPRYFANVAKAQKAQVFTNLDVIRQAQLAYYAVYGIYTSNSFPIVVNVDGDTIVNLADPSNTNWTYLTQQSGTAGCTPSWYIKATKQPGSSCTYTICVASGGEYGTSTCTP